MNCRNSLRPAVPYQLQQIQGGEQIAKVHSRHHDLMVFMNLLAFFNLLEKERLAANRGRTSFLVITLSSTEFAGDRQSVQGTGWL